METDSSTTLADSIFEKLQNVTSEEIKHGTVGVFFISFKCSEIVEEKVTEVYSKYS